MKTKFLLLSIGLSSMSSLNAQTLYVPGGSVGTSSVSGKIGIGLSNPESRVEIKHTGTIGGLFDPTKAFLKITDNSTTLLMDGNEIYSNHILAIGSSYSHDIRFRNVSATGYQELMSIKPTGRVGIGTLSPSQKLHVSSGTSGDAILVLEADTDNNMESDNVEVNFSQDAGLVTGFIGFEGNPGAKSTGTYANAFILGSEDLSDRPIQFIHRDQVQMTVLNKVGIGTTTPTEKLEVNGTIRSKEVKVEASPWPDYVFEPDYELRSLEEIEQFIQSNKHLPEIPSAAEVEENGIALGEMNALLLKKIEELTLYTITQEAKIKRLEEAQGQEPNAKSLEEKIEELTLYLIEFKKENEKLNERIDNDDSPKPTANTQSQQLLEEESPELTANAKSQKPLEKKIEELTLYQIEMMKLILNQAKEIEELKRKMD